MSFGCILVAAAHLSSTPVGAQPFTPQVLNVPPDVLPAGCSLTTLQGQSDGQRVVTTSPPGLGRIENPWIGTDPATIAAILEHLGTRVRVADGPPPSRAELVRMRLGLAEGINGAYAAVYAGDGGTPVSVYALAFTSADAMSSALHEIDAAPLRLVSGTTLIVATGATSPCFPAVRAHLEQVAAGKRGRV